MKLTAEQIDNLFNNGYAYLPQLKFSDIENVKVDVSNKVYTEDSQISRKFLDSFNFEELKTQLAKLAQEKLSLIVEKEDTYSITRVLKSYDNLESYRGHFDSHLFTIVTAVRMPEAKSKESGQLIVFPKIRKEPRNEVMNIYDKIKFKLIYGRKSGFHTLMKRNMFVELDFEDFSSIIFLGRQCFHGNRGFAEAPDGLRITILTHFFDPSKRGIGLLLRKIRKR